MRKNIYPKKLAALSALLFVLTFALSACMFGEHERFDPNTIFQPFEQDENVVVDSDGDKLADDFDNCPTVANPNQGDRNKDGLGDACQDSDGDGKTDDSDNCYMAENVDQADADQDKVGDVCDDDIYVDKDFDDDTIEDEVDNCPEVSNTTQADLDKDGYGDVCDVDKDEDGIDNTTDNCPDVSNQDQNDLDNDGLGDKCDDDIDGDGLKNDNDPCKYDKANSGLCSDKLIDVTSPEKIKLYYIDVLSDKPVETIWTNTSGPQFPPVTPK